MVRFAVGKKPNAIAIAPDREVVVAGCTRPDLGATCGPDTKKHMKAT